MANQNKIQEVVVVHKGPRKNSKIILEVFENTRVDDIISTRKLKPLIPHTKISYKLLSKFKFN